MSTHNSREEIKEIRKTIKDTFELMGQASGWVDLGIERICYLYDQELQKARAEHKQVLVNILAILNQGLPMTAITALEQEIAHYQSELDQPTV